MAYKSPKQIDTEQKERIKELESCLENLYVLSFTEAETRLSIILGSGNGVIPDKLHERCEKIKEVREQAEKLLTQKQ